MCLGGVNIAADPSVAPAVVMRAFRVEQLVTQARLRKAVTSDVAPPPSPKQSGICIWISLFGRCFGQMGGVMLKHSLHKYCENS